MESGQTGKKMSFKTESFLLQYDKFVLNPEKAAKELSKTLITEKGIKWGKWRIVSKLDKPHYVRPWRSGDKFRPAGMKGHKKLQDLFVDKKIPKSERSQIPIIVDENDAIITVGNIRRAEGADERMENVTLELGT